MTSLAITPAGSAPVRSQRIVSGTRSRIRPVPMTKAASVLPMPVANWLNAPAVHVCESVPTSTSPGQVCPRSGRAMWHTPA